MKFKEYLLYKVMPMYFMLVTFLVIFIWGAGTILEPDRVVTYDVLLSPLIYGVVGALPSLMFYSKKELSIRQVIIKKILHFLLLTGFILGFSIWNHVIQSWIQAVAIFLGVCLINVSIQLIQWRKELHTARELSKALANLEE